MIRLFLLFLGFVLTTSCELWAAAKKPPQALPADNSGKKVIALAPVRDVQIEMPDQSLHNFGEDFQAILTTHLMQSGRYIVADSGLQPLEMQSSSVRYRWTGSFVPAAKVGIQVEALSFQTGDRGGRMFYGFNEKFRTPFNDGYGNRRNEFPLRLFTHAPSWFGHSFDRKGILPFDSQSGLDLGDGFKLDALYAWLSVKYAQYHTELHLKLEVEPLSGAAIQNHLIEVKGDGFFFDAAGAYQGYSAAIAVARRDAMDQAVKKAISGAFDAIDKRLSALPLMARLDEILGNGTLLLGTGYLSQVQAGTLFQFMDLPDTVIQVDESVESGSIGHLIRGDLSRVRAGSILRQISSLADLQKPNTLAAFAMPNSESESIHLNSVNLPSSNLDGLVPLITRAQAFALSLAEAIFLPYRIWRYFSYDQSFHKKADLGIWKSANLKKEKWAKRVGFNSVPDMESASPIVAILDSGMDYNHPALHDSLWLNPDVGKSVLGSKDRYGWDFISHDSKPYDDGYHGTQLASLIVGLAPAVKIMPVKVFNPSGITSSAALYAAFVYAVDHGAHLILCGWATNLKSEAIEQGVAYARDHGVPVITSAGDQGMRLSFFPTYPAALSSLYDNVLAVTGVDANDELFKLNGKNSGYDPVLVQLAAPAVTIPVAEPRLGQSRESSSDLAAAFVAGVLSRNLAAQNLSGHYLQWLDQLIAEADSIPGLQGSVRGGLRVHVRR